MAGPTKLYPYSGFDAAGFRGRFTASGASQSFQLAGGYGFFVKVYISSNVIFTAVGSITVTRSLDGGKTWNPFTLSNGTVISTRNTTGKLMFGVPLDQALYRVECALSSGPIDYEVGIVDSGFPFEWRRLTDGTLRDLPVTDIGVIGDPLYIENAYSFVKIYSDAQKQRRFDAKFTSIADADIAGDLTLYKFCYGNNFAKIVVPAAAQRARGPFFITGDFRDIRAEYVNVISTFDGQGNPISSARSFADPTTVYTPGSQVTSRDLIGNSSGAFTAETTWYGIYGHLTLTEAVADLLRHPPDTINFPPSGAPLPNPTALGL